MGDEKLLNLPQLKSALWEPDNCPSDRTLRQWTIARILPSVKLGRLIYYRLPDVRASLDARTKRSHGRAK